MSLSDHAVLGGQQADIVIIGRLLQGHAAGAQSAETALL